MQERESSACFAQVATTDDDGGLENSDDKSVAQTLQHAWVPGDAQARALIDMALVLLADHELNVSSFTARCVASAGAAPHAVVMAGLGALRGYRHGGSSERVASMLSEATDPNDARRIVEEKLKKGETVPDFHHPLYPLGDPRCTALLERFDSCYPRSLELAVTHAFVESMSKLSSLRPNVDLALAALSNTLGLPTGSAIGIFAISRTVGWIAQALEQYELQTLIRPRARYTGLMPR